MSSNPWIQHCKKYSRDYNVPYNVALKEAKGSYQMVDYSAPSYSYSVSISFDNTPHRHQIKYGTIVSNKPLPKYNVYEWANSVYKSVFHRGTITLISLETFDTLYERYPAYSQLQKGTIPTSSEIEFIIDMGRPRRRTQPVPPNIGITSVRTDDELTENFEVEVNIP